MSRTAGPARPHRRSGGLRALAPLLAAVLLLAPAAPAAAATHERVVAPLGLRVSAASGVPGGSVLVSGTGFSTGERVDLFVGMRSVGAVTADAAGSFTGVRIGVPAATPPGAVPVVATGRYSRFTAQADYLVQSSWRQSGYDAARTAANPEEQVIGPSDVADLRSEYVVGSSLPAGPVTVADGRLYFAPGDGAGFYAIATSDRRTVWSHPDAGATNNSTVATPTRIFYQSLVGSREIQALDAKTGRGLWRSAFGGDFSSLSLSLAYDDGALFAVVAGTSSGSGGVVYRLDPATGAVVWQRGSAYQGAPTVSRGTVFVRGLGGTISALDAGTGDLRWTTQVPSADTAPLVVSGDSVVSAFAYGLAVLDRSTGALRWNTASGVTGTVAVSGGLVIGDLWDFTLGRDRLTALDLATGARRWQTDLSLAGPRVAGGVVWVGSDQRVEAVALSDGRRLGTLDLPELDPLSRPDLDAPVTVVDGAVYASVAYYGNRFVAATVVRFVLPDRTGIPTVGSVDDTATGTGAWSYAGGWVAGTRDGAYQGTFHYARSRGATATYAFTGVGARLWYSTAPGFGTMTVSVDGRPVATLDLASPVRRDGTKSITTPTLTRGAHTLTVTSGTSAVVDVDRVDTGSY